MEITTESPKFTEALFTRDREKILVVAELGEKSACVLFSHELARALFGNGLLDELNRWSSRVTVKMNLDASQVMGEPVRIRTIEAVGVEEALAKGIFPGPERAHLFEKKDASCARVKVNGVQVYEYTQLVTCAEGLEDDLI